MEHLREATGENTKSKALDAASEFYIRMAGDTDAIPTGAFEELMKLATEQGSVTPREIAEVLSTDRLPVDYSSEWSVGE